MKAVDALKEALEVAGPGALDALTSVAREAFAKSLVDIATAKPEVAGYMLNDALRAFDALRSIMTLPTRCDVEDELRSRDDAVFRAQEWVTSPAHVWVSFINGALASGRTAGQAAAVADEALAEYERRFGKATP